MTGTKLGLIVTACMSAFASAVLCIIAVVLPSERKIKE